MKNKKRIGERSKCCNHKILSSNEEENKAKLEGKPRKAKEEDNAQDR